MEKADTTAYSTARITGDYAFGAAGFDNVNNRAAIEGRFTSNGTGTLTNPVGDLNGYGTDYPMTFTAANYAVSNFRHRPRHHAPGIHVRRNTGELEFRVLRRESREAVIIESDAVHDGNSAAERRCGAAANPCGGILQLLADSNMVIYLTGTSNCGFGTGVPKAWQDCSPPTATARFP